jgi:hypothetical protein
VWVVVVVVVLWVGDEPEPSGHLPRDLVGGPLVLHLDGQVPALVEAPELRVGRVRAPDERLLHFRPEGTARGGGAVKRRNRQKKKTCFNVSQLFFSLFSSLRAPAPVASDGAASEVQRRRHRLHQGAAGARLPLLEV